MNSSVRLDKGLPHRRPFCCTTLDKHNTTCSVSSNEIDDPIVQRDILDLNRRILLFREGQLNEESFRAPPARGVYGQRQPGVQMIRIKVPMGLLTFDQFRAILDVCDEYSTGKYHLTTRQDIQIHHVKLEDSPELWAKLEASNVTLREACGNTVRNVTASPLAGLDPEEPFNVLPWAEALWRFFLRNPVCQEMGRKFKVSFSSSDEDTGRRDARLGRAPAVNERARIQTSWLVAWRPPAPAEVLHEWVYRRTHPNHRASSGCLIATENGPSAKRRGSSSSTKPWDAMRCLKRLRVSAPCLRGPSRTWRMRNTSPSLPRPWRRFLRPSDSKPGARPTCSPKNKRAALPWAYACPSATKPRRARETCSTP